MAMMASFMACLHGHAAALSSRRVDMRYRPAHRDHAGLLDLATRSSNRRDGKKNRIEADG